MSDPEETPGNDTTDESVDNSENNPIDVPEDDSGDGSDDGSGDDIIDDPVVDEDSTGDIEVKDNKKRNIIIMVVVLILLLILIIVLCVVLIPGSSSSGNDNSSTTTMSTLLTTLSTLTGSTITTSSLVTSTAITPTGHPPISSTPDSSTPIGSTKTPPNSDEHETTTMLEMTTTSAQPISELHFLTFNPSLPEQEAFSWYQYNETYQEEEHFGVMFDTPDVLSSKSQSCSVTLQGERYLIGGYGTTEQYNVFQINGNEFKKLSPLEFAFVDGLCTVYKNSIVLVPSGNKRTCYIADQKGIQNGQWEELPKPNINHYGGGIAVMNDRLVLFGGNDNGTEVYYPNQKKWVQKDSNGHKMRHFSVQEFHFENYPEPMILLFGGHGEDGGATNAVYEFTKDYDYRPIGHLEVERTLHRSICQDNTIVHIGGDGKHANASLPMEIWVWNEEKNDFDIHVSKHELNGWSRYPETFLIEKNEFAAWYNSHAIKVALCFPLTLSHAILNVF